MYFATGAEHRGELRTAVDAKLAKSRVEVSFDGLRADYEEPADGRGREPVGRELSNPQLGRRERPRAVGLATSGPVALCP